MAQIFSDSLGGSSHDSCLWLMGFVQPVFRWDKLLRGTILQVGSSKVGWQWFMILSSGVIKHGWLGNPMENGAFWLGKSSINNRFSIAMLDYWRGTL